MKRLATILFILIMFSCLAGALIPQRSLKSPQFLENWKKAWPNLYQIIHMLSLDSVFSSFWFALLIFAFLVLLAYFICLQLKVVLKNRKKPELKGIKPDDKNWIKIVLKNGDNSADIKYFLRKKGYKDTVSEGEHIVFEKNYIGRYASIIFHTGIFIIVLYGFIYACFHKRGFVQLIHGDTFSGKQGNFISCELGILQKEFNPGFQVYLAEFEHTYWENNELKDLRSFIITNDRKEEKKWVIMPNRPIEYRNLRIYQSMYYGYTLSFSLIKNEGEPIVCYFSLDMTNKPEKPLKGISDFPTTPYIFDMEFYPDETRRSFYLNNPYVKLSINTDKGNVFKGIMHPGDEITFDSVKVRFMGVRKWSGLIFTYTPGEAVIYLGFILSLLGVFIMYFLPFKQIYCVFDKMDSEQILYMRGFSLKFSELFKKEVEKLGSEIFEIISRKDFGERYGTS